MHNKKKKEEAILFFLKKYGVLFDFEDGSYLSFKKRISVDGECTFRKWKEKTFSDPSAKVMVFGCYEPANQTKFENIKKENAAKSVIRIFDIHKDAIKNDAKDFIKAEKKNLKRYQKNY